MTLIANLAADDESGEFQASLVVVGQELLAPGLNGRGQHRRGKHRVWTPGSLDEAQSDAACTEFPEQVRGQGNPARSNDHLADAKEREFVDRLPAQFDLQALALFAEIHAEPGENQLRGIFGLSDAELAVAIRGQTMFQRSGDPIRVDGRLSNRRVAGRKRQREAFIDNYLASSNVFGQHHAPVRVKQPARLRRLSVAHSNRLQLACEQVVLAWRLVADASEKLR